MRLEYDQPRRWQTVLSMYTAIKQECRIEEPGLQVCIPGISKKGSTAVPRNMTCLSLGNPTGFCQSTIAVNLSKKLFDVGQHWKVDYLCK